jgi:hypothetical protein
LERRLARSSLRSDEFVVLMNKVSSDYDRDTYLATCKLGRNACHPKIEFCEPPRADLKKRISLRRIIVLLTVRDMSTNKRDIDSCPKTTDAGENLEKIKGTPHPTLEGRVARLPVGLYGARTASRSEKNW